MSLPEILHYGFMQRALLAGALVGALTAAVGTYVVLRGMAFLGAGISHAAFGGVALGYLLGLNPTAFALLFCILASWAIAASQRIGKLKGDVPIGILFASSMAIGAIAIGLMKEYTIDLFSYLFGSILAVTFWDLIVALILGTIVFSLVLIFYRQFLYIAFDPQMARVSGIPVVAMDMLLLGMISVTIVISMKIVGIILVSSLLVAPAATAVPWVRSFKSLLGLSAAIGAGGSVGGVIISYYLNTPSGATIALLLALGFFASAILKRGE